ncbi:MAG: bifunctional 5,10-methylenetetrahydrofolate dehydrogenase/5,10-methenyltetrahydrofolate cyclohydrolase [Patescibacteria group bacterium]
MSKILDGKKLRDQLVPQLIKKIRETAYKPKLVIIQIGNLKESNSYIKKKKAFGQKLGALVVHKQYPENISEKEVISDISKYNSDSSVHGIMIQLPIPKNLNGTTIIEAIDPEKDVDGLTAKNTKLLFDNTEAFVPATTQGIITLLQHNKIDLVGKKVVIVGESTLVGRPTILALLNRKATVTVCHIHTKNLEKETKQADILIVAVGQPHLITPNHVSKNQIVIDVGITVTEKKKVVGDVDYKKVKNIVGAITPVPGGVGPMTVFSLFENLIKSYLYFTKYDADQHQ